MFIPDLEGRKYQNLDFWKRAFTSIRLAIMLVTALLGGRATFTLKPASEP